MKLTRSQSHRADLTACIKRLSTPIEQAIVPDQRWQSSILLLLIVLHCLAAFVPTARGRGFKNLHRAKAPHSKELDMKIGQLDTRQFLKKLARQNKQMLE